MFAFGEETILYPVIEIVDIGLRIEAGEGAKSVAPIGVVHEVIQFPSIALQGHFCRRAGQVGSERADVVASVAAKSGALHPLKARYPVRIQLEAAINAADPVEIRTHFAIGEHDSDGGLVPNVAADAAYRKVSMFSE